MTADIQDQKRTSGRHEGSVHMVAYSSLNTLIPNYHKYLLVNEYRTYLHLFTVFIECSQLVVLPTLVLLANTRKADRPTPEACVSIFHCRGRDLQRPPETA